MKPYLVFKTTLSSCAMIAIAGFGLSEQAQAFNISGNSSGNWGDPIAVGINTEPLYTGVGTNSFTWGEAAVDKPNELKFQGNSFSQSTGSWFKIGSLNYYNAIVYAGTSVDIVPLNLQFSLNDSQNNTQLSKTFSIYFNLINTPNIIQNNLKDTLNDDFVIINRNVDNASFIFGKNQYKFELKGFGETGDSSIRAGEGDSFSTEIYGRIQAVPEPTTIASSLLVGIFLLNRKRLSQKLKSHRDK